VEVATELGRLHIKGCNYQDGRAKVKYEDFTISMEPASLDALAKVIRHAVLPNGSTIQAELLNFACEIEARMQHFAQNRTAPEEDWLS
jgi:hypothetical protein